MNRDPVPSMDPSPQHDLHEAQHNEGQEKSQAGMSVLSTTHNDTIVNDINEKTPSVQSKLWLGRSIKNNGSNITLSHLENIPPATEIKLSVKKLTLSIVPEPSFIVRLCRLLARKSKSKRTTTFKVKNKNRHSDHRLNIGEHQDHFESKTGSGEESSVEDLQHSTGINIFRHISFDVEPGQGKNNKSEKREGERRDSIMHRCLSSASETLLTFCLFSTY